jgi:hypothetical protein
MTAHAPIVIVLGDDDVGYCHSCDRLIDTGTIDARGRFCCGVCGDYLEFADDEDDEPSEAQ